MKPFPHAACLAILCSCGPAIAEDRDLTFSGGHETDPKDGGRPCVLIAAALGVKTEVFRDAFKGVTPAKNGKPSGDEARANKEVLLKALKPHGVTNDRLDEVSDYYRYRPQDGKLWKHREAKAIAVVKDDKIEKIVVTDAGAGYSTPPKVTIKGMEKIELIVTLQFDQDLAKNGSIKSIEIAPPTKKD
ncbi:MAG TPA: hypothetical protein VHR66_32080 [Gemmataceae bacterium]|nr:hypothetical protein [Gemmataceae bacterium]